MKHRILLGLIALLLAAPIGCATRGGTRSTLLSEADGIHARLTALLDRVPSDHPLHAELVSLLETTGQHRDRCLRVEVQLRLINATMAVDDLLTNGIAGFELRLGGSGRATGD